MSAPTQGVKTALAARLIRLLLKLPPSAADAPLFDTAISSSRCKASSLAKKAVAALKWKCKVVAQKSLGILPSTDVHGEVVAYLNSGVTVDVQEEYVDERTGRRYWRLKDGRGWIPETSRKDALKIVVLCILKPDEKAIAAAKEALALAEKAKEEAVLLRREAALQEREALSLKERKKAQAAAAAEAK